MADGPSAYDEWHSRLGPNVGAEDPWYGLVKAHLRREDLEGRAVLEIGCGRGGFVCWLAMQPHSPSRLVGVDYSAVAIEKCRELATASGITAATWKTGDIQGIDEPDESFDSVFSCETIEHVPQPRKAVAELARVLRPGGRLFLTVPNYLGTYGLYRLYLRARGRRFTEVGQPINHFTTLPAVSSWVKRAGLKIVKSAGVGHYLFWPGHTPIRLELFDVLPLKWLALHSLIVGRKPW